MCQAMVKQHQISPDAGETTPDVPGNGEAILDTLDAGETMPDTPGGW